MKVTIEKFMVEILNISNDNFGQNPWLNYSWKSQWEYLEKH